MILASLLHAEFGDRGIQQVYFGYIISIYGFFGVVGTFIAPFFINALGRSKVLYLAIFVVSIFYGFFGYVTLIESNTIMITVAMTLRAFQGCARVLTAVPCVSLLNIIEPAERLRYMGYIEAMHKIGIAFGPVLGSIMYKFVGFI